MQNHKQMDFYKLLLLHNGIIALERKQKLKNEMVKQTRFRRPVSTACKHRSSEPTVTCTIIIITITYSSYIYA